jgi:hypothetical protein
MKLWWHLLHGWAGQAAGAVVCWWRNDHVVMWQAGMLPTTTWGGFTFDDFSLNNDPDDPSNLYWERTYCTRCGVTLKEETL